jgi:hypothetical protein
VAVVRRALTELLSDALSVTHRGKFRGSPRFAKRKKAVTFDPSQTWLRGVTTANFFDLIAGFPLH